MPYQPPHQSTQPSTVDDVSNMSLARVIEQQPFSSQLETRLALALSVTTAVQTLHQQYTVHGSLNPTTIYLNPTSNNRIQLIAPQHGQRQQLPYMAPEQTGRLKHPFDQRTDLYTLGVIFYELFVGQQPFALRDPVQLIHAHLATPPVSPRQLRPDLPTPVSDIVLKLLAKEPEDRYQSAAGLATDLSHCLAAWQAEGQIAPFELAENDMSARLLLPAKRYGHTAVWAQLQTLMLADNSPPAQLLCLWGEAGLGKSRLLSDLHTAVSRTETTWLFHQAQPTNTTSPYTAVTALLQAFVRQLLTRDPVQIAHWQTRLTHTLVGNITQLLRHIPELRLLLDLSPDHHIEASDPQLLLRMACQNMLALLAETEPRLVLVVDDAHHIDPASRELLQQLVAQRQRSVIVLLAARPAPDFAAWLDADPAIQQMSLTSLALADTAAFVADTLHTTAVEATPLAELLQRKTSGNPLFLRELMHALHDDHGLLTFEPTARRWQWDLAQIEAAPLADNVVALVQKRLELLPTAVQQTLKVAALLGNWFELDLLTQACQQTWGETAQAVWQARTLGLLQPHDPTAVTPFAAAQPPSDVRVNAFQQMTTDYLVAPTSAPDVNKEPPQLAPPPRPTEQRYQFAHEQVRQAAMRLLPTEDTAVLEWQIGWRLWQGMSPAQREANLFVLVRHLGQPEAVPHMSQTERTAVAEIHAQAAQAALALVAYDNALAFARYGLHLLDEHDPDLMRRLTLTAAQAAARSGHFAEAEQWLDRLAQAAPRGANAAPVAVIQERMLVYYLQGKHEDAAVVALAALRQLGVRLPAQPGRRHLAAALLRTQLALGRQPLARLEALPPMTDPTSQQVMEIMAAATISLASANPALLMRMGLEMVLCTLQAGKHPFSAIGYALYGVLLCAATGQIERGYALGQLALRQAADIEMKEYRVFVSYFVHAHISHWRDHIRQTLQPLRDLGQTGEFEYLAVAAGLYPYFTWFIAELDLTASERAIGENMHLLASFEGTPLYYRYQMGQQYYRNLLGLAEKPHELVGEVYDARRAWPRHLAENDQTTLFYVACHQLTLCYLFGAYAEAVAAAVLATAQKDGGVGTPLLPVLAFYEALAHLALADTAVVQPNWKRRVAANQRQLRRWAKHSPANCAHRVSLVAAEQARVAGQHGRARELYDTAVAQASEQDYLPELALIHEVTARYYVGRGQPTYATHHLQQAVHCYRRWGATGKLEQLAQLYPDLLAEAPAEASGSFANLSAYVDMATVLKATQLLSSETALPALLDKLTHILIENAGAQAGGLFLPQGKQWQLASYQPEQMAERTAVALPFVWQVAHTQEPLQLSEESLITPRHVPPPPRALLCLPLLDQGELVGVFYLENQLTRYAFPAERLPLLTALATQAAISLKNATLVAGLERARQNIQASEQRFRLLFDNAPLGILEVNIATEPPRIRAANQRAEAVYGWSAQEMGALPSAVVMTPAESRPAMQRLIETVRSGQPAFTESVHQRRDGTLFPVRIMATPAPEPDGLHMIVAVEDITAVYQRRSELQAIEDERQRIAQEIHDGVAQDLAFLRLKFGLWRDGISRDPAQVQTELTETQAIVDNTLEDLRRAIYALRPLALESIGFLPALRRYIADFNNQQTVYVTLQVDVTPEQVPAAQELVLFRVVQEGLNNIAQHAQASLAWVVLEGVGGDLVLTVRDNGRGFDAKTAETPPNGHLGLLQMRERVAQAGGQLHLISRVGQGTEIRLTISSPRWGQIK